MILGRFLTSSDKLNVYNIFAVTVTMGGGGFGCLVIKEQINKMEYEIINIKNGLFFLIQKLFFYSGLWRIRF